MSRADLDDRAVFAHADRVFISSIDPRIVRNQDEEEVEPRHADGKGIMVMHRLDRREGS